MSLIINLGLLVFIAVGCATKGDGWQPELYTGDPLESKIIRGAERGSLACNDPLFKDYACMSHKDLERLFKACLDTKNRWLMGN